MKFAELLESISIYEEQHGRLGNKFPPEEDYKNFDIRYYPELKKDKPVETKPATSASLTGPIISAAGHVWRKSLNAAYESEKFLEEWMSGTEEEQAIVSQALEDWKNNKIPAVIDPKKHTLYGMVWDLRHRDPSIKIILAIDGAKRVLVFDEVIFGYDKYKRRFIA